ncbi:hypothetical protein CPB84DRAFT_1744844 [Gymnopilus junonius]|uniref:Proteophosphoglycan ppg4 n=1 Tax=Gymnopilus junonius TaxID=109634 RepID=A0A9P5NS55_GYMJU|nr:hypothetical protein CPB84DRAFT_1744844 [Gymnopilus junonius]
MPPPGSSEPRETGVDSPSDSPSPQDNSNSNPDNSNSNSSPTNPRRLSRDSEGYPSWLPKRPPPPAPASTFQSSVLGGPSGLHTSTPSPVEGEVDPNQPDEFGVVGGGGAGSGRGRNPFAWIGGRKPTPRSVRIVSLQDSFVGAVEKEARMSSRGGAASREPTDQTQVGSSSGVPAPPKVKVWSRAAGAPQMPSMATAFRSANQEELLPLPQPRFKAKNLNLQLLRSPSPWMMAYFYLWPLIVFYHIPLQTFFDFNAVFMLLQVAKFPNPGSTGKNWALGAAAYIASWLAWIFVICVVYELVYSFSRRWRLRRPLMLPIYLSSPAFKFVAMTSYNTFCFLQLLRLAAFIPKLANTLSPVSHTFDASDDIYVSDEEDELSSSESGWKQGLAETCFFYSQNLPTVALLLPRAGLCLALLFTFSSPQPSLNALITNSGLSTSNLNNRDATFFRQDGTGALTSYARGVLIANAAWAGWRILVLLVSWLGLWFFSNQRLGGLCGPRHVWEESEQEKTRSIYSEAASEYGAYRSSYYHAGNGGTNFYGYEEGRQYAGDELPWQWREVTRMRVQDAFEFCLNNRRGSTVTGQGLRWSTASGGELPPSAAAYRDRRFRNRRGHHKRQSTAKGKETAPEKSEVTPQQAQPEESFEGIERVLAAVGFPGPASPSRRGVLSKDLFDAPAIAIEADKDRPKIAPLEFGQPVASTSTNLFGGLEAPKTAKRNSKDRISGLQDGPLLNLPYPFSRPGAGQVSSKDSVPFPPPVAEGKKTRSKKSTSKSGSGSGSTEEESGNGSGGTEEEEEEEEEEDDDDDDDDDEEDFGDSEIQSSERASGSMSSLGQPISPSRYPFGMRRPVGTPGQGHGRSMSGVSSGLSSGGAGTGSQSHGHSHSMSSQGGALSVVTHSTGNAETTDSEFGLIGSNHNGNGNGSGIPMPPRHPHISQGQGRGRSSTVVSTSSGSSSAAAALAAPVAFPSLQQRGRVESGRGIVVDPSLLYGIDLADDEVVAEDADADAVADLEEQQAPGEMEEDAETRGEHEDRVGLLGLPTSARNSRVSLTGSSSGSGRHDPERVLTLLPLCDGSSSWTRWLGGNGGGTRSRPRSRVNSSMARLEEEVVFSPSHATELSERGRRGASGASSGSGRSGNSGGSRARREAEAAGYASSVSAGTHSRSGSEAENYTFGRPIAFMRPQPEQHQDTVQEEGEIGLGPQPGSLPQSFSVSESMSFYSLQPSEHTASPPTGTSLPVPIHVYREDASIEHSPSPPQSTSDHSSERQGIAIPWSQSQSYTQTQHNFLAPPRAGAGSREVPISSSPTTGSGSGSSPPDISTAAGSFITAPATIDGVTTTATESTASVGSWDTATGIPIGGGPLAARRRTESGGMVERPGDDMGAAGGHGAWRVV